MSMVWSYAGLKDELAAYLKPASGFMVGLYQNNFSPAKNSTIADFTEATFPGYSRQSPDPWGTPFTNGSGLEQVDGQNTVFLQNAVSGGPQTIYGYFVVDAGGVYIFGEKFALPANFINPGDQLTLISSVIEDVIP